MNVQDDDDDEANLHGRGDTRKRTTETINLIVYERKPTLALEPLSRHTKGTEL